ncbi:MAG: hypothetical protein ABI591_31865 [Kofleriaceae bacterium]
MRHLALVVLVGACSDPSFALRFRVTSGSEAACTNTSGEQVTACADVTMQCRAVVSIRIFAPSDPTSPYISVCKELSGQSNVCSIAGVDLPQPAIPVNGQTLEVQMAVYPLEKITTDPNTGDLQCPTGVAFDARGFPVESIQPCTPTDLGDCPPSPAIGGVAFYHPGDEETIVDLGCTDLAQLNDPTCTGESQVKVSATVDDFDTEVSVQSSVADHLSLYMGEPIATTAGDGSTHYQLPLGVNPLTRSTATTPTWSGTVTEPFKSECLQVLEDVAGATTAVRCQPFSTPPPSMIAAIGTRLTKESLAELVQALGLVAFPDDGLVIGVVLDPLGNPVQSLQVTSSAGTVSYLSADRQSVTTTSTSSNGIFMSRDTPYADANGAISMFRTSSMTQSAVGFGGLIDRKATIVILQFQTPQGM